MLLYSRPFKTRNPSVLCSHFDVYFPLYLWYWPLHCGWVSSNSFLSSTRLFLSSRFRLLPRLPWLTRHLFPDSCWVARPRHAFRRVAVDNWRLGPSFLSVTLPHSSEDTPRISTSPFCCSLTSEPLRLPCARVHVERCVIVFFSEFFLCGLLSTVFSPFRRRNF